MFDLADVSTVVLSGVRSVSPEIAERVPDDVDATLVDVRERKFATYTLDAADTVRRWPCWRRSWPCCCWRARWRWRPIAAGR